MELEWSTGEGFRDARRVAGPLALPASDFTARIVLRDLPAGADVFYRVASRDARDERLVSEAVAGRLRTPPATPRHVRFCFSGDEVGQGWGIDRGFGGLRMYETMRRTEPDFFVHAGDQIYADGPLAERVPLDDGATWTNLVTPEKAVVAESLREFRGNFAYSLLDEHKRRFASRVPFLVQWDDHEVRNNWFPGQRVPARAAGAWIEASLLAARARRAMLEYAPFVLDPAEGDAPLFRSFPYGPSLEVFLLDLRSHRGANGPNREPASGAPSAMLGAGQLAWLERGLRASRATWKVVASDQPLSLVVPDRGPYVPEGWYEAWANGDRGAPLGRELEVARLLASLHRHGVRNVVWITADVHYACAIHYDPRRAAFRDFTPFWEFVAGPLHAGTFPPGELDPSFRPELRFLSVPRDLKPNRPPQRRSPVLRAGRARRPHAGAHRVAPQPVGRAPVRSPALPGARRLPPATRPSGCSRARPPRSRRARSSRLRTPSRPAPELAEPVPDRRRAPRLSGRPAEHGGRRGGGRGAIRPSRATASSTTAASSRPASPPPGGSRTRPTPWSSAGRARRAPCPS
jgi:alkaline phosphatase D